MDSGLSWNGEEAQKDRREAGGLLGDAKRCASGKAWRRGGGGWRADGCTLDQVSRARGRCGREWGQGIGDGGGGGAVRTRARVAGGAGGGSGARAREGS